MGKLWPNVPKHEFSGYPSCNNLVISYTKSRPGFPDRGAAMLKQKLEVLIQPDNHLLPAFRRYLCMGSIFHH